MNRDERRDRRRSTGDFRTKPRSSPAAMLVLTVSAVLLITAAATALLGGGFSDATPHGRLLGALERVSEAQNQHHVDTGTFAAWERALEVAAPEGVELKIVYGTDESWEALATDPEVGLSCMQNGTWRNGRHVVEPPICYR